MLIVIFRLGLFLGEHDDVEGIFAHPLGGISQGVLVFADVATSFPYGIVLPLIAGQDVVDGFGSELVKGFLEDAGHAELPLHQGADTHHQVLAESLEHEEVVADVVHRAAVLLDGGIDFLEKVVAQPVNLLEHFLAAALFGNSQLVVLRGYFQCTLEHGDIGQEREVGDTQVARHDRLVIHPDEGHEVLHAAYFLFCIVGFLFKYVE